MVASWTVVTNFAGVVETEVAVNIDKADDNAKKPSFRFLLCTVHTDSIEFIPDSQGNIDFTQNFLVRFLVYTLVGRHPWNVNEHRPENEVARHCFVTYGFPNKWETIEINIPQRTSKILLVRLTAN